MASKLKITQIRSGSGRVPNQRKVLAGLGLKGPRSEVIRPNTPDFRGMVKKVLHLVNVEEING